MGNDPQHEENTVPARMEDTTHNPNNRTNWGDVIEENIINSVPRTRAPTRYLAEGHHLTSIGEDMDNYLMAQTSYVESMQTITEVDGVIDHAIHHIVLTQLGMKAGIRAFGEAGVRSILKEMKQFHDREVVRPLLPSEVTPDIKRRALGYLVFLKMKTTGEIKAR